MRRSEVEEIYNEIIAKAGLERKGKTMPYTSANGYMFSQLNKNGEIGIRLSKEHTKDFHEKYGAASFISYGAKMREYVLIPDSLFNEVEILADYLKKGYSHVCSLPPK